MNLYVTTSAFYAILDADDDRHPAAQGAWKDLLGGRPALHASNYVILETVILL